MVKSPKSITYWEKDEFLKHDFSCAVGNDGGFVCIVEDQLSAEVLHSNLNLPVVALLGSHIPDNLILHLRKRMNYKRIYIMLDKDAWDKAHKYAHRFSLLGTTAIEWEGADGADPKNMTVAQLQENFGWLQ